MSDDLGREAMKVDILVFFFQAEDGIRDPLVTGVQTCALPIFAGLITKLGAPKGTVPADMDLLEFAEPAWIVSTLGVGYDDDHDRIIVEAHELFEEEEEGQRAGEEPASARVRITREQAQAFVTRVTELMKAGRPNCPVCSEPMDAGGHVCRRSNGHI